MTVQVELSGSRLRGNKFGGVSSLGSKKAPTAWKPRRSFVARPPTMTALGETSVVKQWNVIILVLSHDR
jgi:hypothetical protein